MRWPVMIGPAGLACVMAYHSLGIPGWKERQAQARAAALPPGVDRLHPEATFHAPPSRVPPRATDLPGLLGYWSFDNDSLAPSVADDSGKGNRGTIHGATWTAGLRGKALTFNSGDAHLEYGNSPDFNFATNAPFSLACWVKTPKTSAIICGQQSSTDQAVNVSLTVVQGNACGIVCPDQEKKPAQVVGRTRIADDTWHHLALTRDKEGTIELFVDGASQGQATAPGANGPITTDLRMLGSDPRWIRLKWDSRGRTPDLYGAIDEFCILGRQLTAGEIRTLAGR
jgi:hypothetical protein